MRKLFYVISIFITTQIGFSQELIDEPIPTDILLKKSKQHTFSISPDGKFFAEVIENNIERDIVIIDIDKYILHHRIPMGRKQVNNIYWLTPNRLLYESTGSIHAIDIDGSNSTQIVSRTNGKLNFSWRSFKKNFRFNSLVSTLPSNKNEILIESIDGDLYSSIKRVNIFTGKKINVLNGKFEKINKWFLNSQMKGKIGMKYVKENIKYVIKNNQNKWEQFFINYDSVRKPLNVNSSSYLNQNMTFEGFSFDPNRILLTTNVNSDKRKLIEYDIENGKVVKTLLENNNCDINDPHGVGSLIIFDGDKSEVAGVRYEGILPAYKWFSKSFKSVHDTLKKFFPRHFNDIIDFDANKNRFLVYQWSDIDRGNIGVYDKENKKYDIMFYFNADISKYKLSKTKVITIKSRDNNRIPCYLNLPTNYSQDKKAPLIVLPHGGPWARDYWEFNNDVHYFTTRGFAVLRVNFRGSTGFGKKHVEAGIKNLDKIMIDDIADATKDITKRFSIDQNRVFIYGYSYGGYATYMSLLKYPELYKSGVAISAPTDIKKWMKQQKKEKNYFSYEFWKTALGSKKSKYLSEISPINFADKIRKPVLIFHGKRDGVISVEQAEKMSKELKKYNAKSKIEILNNEGHTIKNSNTLGYVLDTIHDFFVTGN